MRRKPKVYLDTSVLSALFDKRNPDMQFLTKLFFEKEEDFDIYISDVVLAEIERTRNLILRKKLEEEAYKFKILNMTDEVEWLANQYVAYGVVPAGYAEDAFHIAMAVFYEMDFFISWNFIHIVRKKTIELVQMVNNIFGFRNIEILTPAHLI